jgi:hypothetical protein
MMHTWKILTVDPWQKPGPYKYSNKPGGGMLDHWRTQIHGQRDDDQFFYVNVVAPGDSTEWEREAILRGGHTMLDQYL